uniref:Uncharacterized protein n=1 Tax=Panagrolaimus davidi TaxID=227884 RepID=A0A914P1N4_9BILA
MFEKPFLGSLTQAHVILARGAGIFHPSVNDFEDKCVCQNHFEELLSKWNSRDFKHIIWRKNKDQTRKTACSFPEGYGINHGTQRPLSERVVTYEESEAFLKECHLLIHVDLPICRKHKDYINQYVQNNENITKSDSSSSNANSQSQQKDDTEKSDSSPSAADSESSGFVPIKNPTPSKKPQSVLPKEISEAIDTFFDVAGIERASTNIPFDELKVDTKRKKVQIFEKVMNIFAKYMAPDNPNALLNLFQKNPQVQTKISKQVDHLMTDVKDQYLTAENDSERREILAQISNSIPLKTVQEYIPNLTRYLYSRARKEAVRRKTKFKALSKKRIVIRYRKADVLLFIEFITGPLVTIHLPYGTKKTKLSSGLKINIPNTVRKYRDHEIILMFRQYLKEINREDVKLSYSTMKRILKACVASRRISLQCVDYYLANGYEVCLH